MVAPSPSEIDLIEVARRGPRSLVLAARSGWYLILVLVVVLGAGAYNLRTYGIFSCQASNYSSDRYLSYCNATSYGDYDHGAIWFGLEPAANAAAADARVLFIGNSRTQYAFSTKATDDWFSSVSASYFLLGFSHDENYTFEAPLLHKLHPRAKVYVVNIDSFFDRSESGPGRTVMWEEAARARYEEKRNWQRIHQSMCTTFKSLCGHDEVIFRSRSNGTWLLTDNQFPGAPVSYVDTIDQNKVASYTALGKDFLTGLTADPACTILTIIPTVKTSIGTAQAVASSLGWKLVAPRVEGLITFDHAHLDPESAQRWSAAFLNEASQQIRTCLSK